jgi:hypothetical protein
MARAAIQACAGGQKEVTAAAIFRTMVANRTTTAADG